MFGFVGIVVIGYVKVFYFFLLFINILNSVERAICGICRLFVIVRSESICSMVPTFWIWWCMH